MTLSSDDAKARKAEKRDQDIRNHPEYKTPWWRKPLKPQVFWIIFAAAAVVVAVAVILTVALGVPLF